MTMYYSEVDGTEPTISIQIKDTKYTFTNESLARLIEDKESIKAELLQTERKIKSLQFDVKEFFQSRYDTDHDEILCDVDEINELLTSIGSEKLTKTWSASITIMATITGIEGSSKDIVEDIIKDNIEVNLNADGDLWVDDVSVDSVYPEA
jgi:seryl-tRNA synthetase